MFSFTVLGKPNFTKPNGDNIVDLTTASVRPLTGSDYANIKRYYVSEDFEMRADLIANDLYGDQNMVDLFMKFNAISNPFSIDTKKLLMAPGASTLTGMTAPFSGEIIDKAESRRQNQVLLPKTRQDKTRIDAIRASDPSPVNFTKPGDKNIKVENGKIIFGEDVTRVNNEKCGGSISRAKLKEKLLKNKIFNVNSVD